MGTALVIIILLFLLFPAILRWSRGWILRTLQKRAAKYFHEQAAAASGHRGGPDRNSGAKSSGSQSAWDSFFGRRSSGKPRKGESDGPIIPGEYAEDAEFIEIKDFSPETEPAAGPSSRANFRNEEQVEDAQIIEIRKNSDSK